MQQPALSSQQVDLKHKTRKNCVNTVCYVHCKTVYEQRDPYRIRCIILTFPIHVPSSGFVNNCDWCPFMQENLINTYWRLGGRVGPL